MIKTLSIVAITSCATVAVPLTAFAQMSDQGGAMGGDSMQKGSMGGMSKSGGMMKKHHRMHGMHHKGMMKSKSMSGGGM